jgi:hypothetical protein
MSFSDRRVFKLKNKLKSKIRFLKKARRLARVLTLSIIV